MKRISKVSLLIMALVICFSVTAYAAGVVSVTIYTGNATAQSISMYCSSMIDGFGANDKSSSRALYYQIYHDKLIDSKDYSYSMAPGKGAKSGTTVTWDTRFLGETVFTGNGNYFVKLNVDGINKTGCDGAGKLVD